MAQPDSISTPRSFPNFAQAVIYEQALEYVQLRLNAFGRGQLKPFCLENKLPYPTTVNLKNNKLKEEQPLLVLKILTSLTIATELIRHPTQGKKPYFMFPTKEALATFQEQLCMLQGS